MGSFSGVFSLIFTAARTPVAAQVAPPSRDAYGDMMCSYDDMALPKRAFNEETVDCRFTVRKHSQFFNYRVHRRCRNVLSTKRLSHQPGMGIPILRERENKHIRGYKQSSALNGSAMSMSSRGSRNVLSSG